MPRSRSPFSPRERRGASRETTPMRREPASRCSLLCRGLSKSARADDLRYMADKYGPVKDVYVPKDHYTGEGRGLAFIEFVNNRDAEDAKYGMDRQIMDGKEISVVFALQGRKRPEDYRSQGAPRPPSRYGGGGGGYGGGGYDRGYDRGGGDRGHDRGYDRGGYGRDRDYRGGGGSYRRRSYSRSRSPVRRRRSYSRSPSRSPRRGRSPSRSPSRSPRRSRGRSLTRSRSRTPADRAVSGSPRPADRSVSRSPARADSPPRSPARID